MSKVAVDVGSGVTKVRGESGALLQFPSVVGKFSESQRGFLADPRVFESHVSRLVKPGQYLFGVQAETLIAPANRANTLSLNWSGSDAWGVLLLAAIGALYPDGFDGPIEVATGVPQAIYNERRESVLALMEGQHDFSIGGRRYSVVVRPHVFPQAAAAVLACDDLNRAVGSLGVVDIGTYTTGMAVVSRKSMEDSYSVQYWRCGGIEVGVSRIVEMISEAISREFGGRPDAYVVHQSIVSKRMFIRGQEVDISKMVDHAVNTVSEQIIEAVSRLWPHGAMDLFAIDLVGGGAPLIYGRMKEVFAQSRLVDSPQWAIVNGLYQAIS